MYPFPARPPPFDGAVSRLHFTQRQSSSLISESSGAAAKTPLPAGIEMVERCVLEAQQLTLPSGAAGADVHPEGLFPMGLGSALLYSGARKDGTLLFFGLTDRGPSLPAPRVRLENDGTADARYFLSPFFQPRLVRIEVSAGRARALGPIALTNEEGKPYTGLPPKDAADVVALSLVNDRLTPGARSIDPEGLAADGAGGFWVMDEYGPALRQFSAQGVEKRVLLPGAGLPQYLAGRPRTLRGLTAAGADDGRRLLTFDRSAFGVERCFTLIESDPESLATRCFLWPIERKLWKRTARPTIGDLAHVAPGRFIAIEQGDAKGGGRLLQLVLGDYREAEDVSGCDPATLGRLRRGRPGLVGRRTLVNLADLGWSAAKAKGVAVLPDMQTVAVVSDNNFGAEVRVEDPAFADAPVPPSAVDYVLEPDGGYSFAGKPTAARIIVGRRPPAESRTDLFLIRFAERLDA